MKQKLRTLDNRRSQRPIANARAPRFQNHLAKRVLLIWVMAILGGIGLVANLYRLQILEGAKLSKKAQQQQTTKLSPFVPRRPIADRNGNLLAIDRPVYTLYAHPKQFKKSPEVVAAKLAPILLQSSESLLGKFRQKKSGIRLANGIKEETADLITKLQTNGLELLPDYARFYPQGELVADIIGYVDGEHRGQAGIEYSQENVLKRAIQSVQVNRSGNGAFMPDKIPEGFLQADDLQLQLTVDTRLQRAARLALKKQMQESQANRGTVIVMDVRDGSLLALVSEPTYDPNQYSQFDISLFKNWALTDLYEPGSTFKPLNIAIALDSGAVKSDDTFNDPGQIQIGDRIIKNAEGGGQGTITIAQILQHSSNVGMVKIMRQVPPQVHYSWLEKMRLGSKTGIDLPFEALGQTKNAQEFTHSLIERATAAFGQGLAVTPIHLAQLHAAIANGGKLVTPHVVQGLFDSQGQMYWQPPFSPAQPLFSAETTQKVLAMMEIVVNQGTGKTAKIPGYRIGGKTGTSQKASLRGGYSQARIASFVGILPIESPRYLVLAVVDEPKGSVFGATVAAPVVKSVMEALITIERIPPSANKKS